MNIKKVCRRWGTETLNTKKFKSANENESLRAKMACSLIKNKKQYLGKSQAEIRKIFGDYSGHYFSDTIPAYLIETAEKKGDDSWQIVFLLNNNWKVSNIAVHKNCCFE